MARRSPKSDPQREEVYRWEGTFSQLFYDHAIGKRAAHRLERDIARYYSIGRPKLRTVRGGKAGFLGAAYSDPRPMIMVNTDLGAMTAPLIAHEISHLIVPLYDYEEPDHGPVWLGVYMHVLDAQRILPLSMTVPSAKAAGLRFRDPATCGPKDL